MKVEKNLSYFVFDNLGSNCKNEKYGSCKGNPRSLILYQAYISH